MGTTEGGEREDFESFFLRCHPPLVGALSVAVGFDAAEEAAQEAFVQAGVRWGRVSRMDHPAAWVRRVAVNRLIDRHRRSQRRDRAVTRLGAPLAVELTPADHELASAVALLPERQRLAVALHYLLDLPIAEVARLLSVSEGTVKSNLHDARAALRTHLEVVDEGR